MIKIDLSGKRYLVMGVANKRSLGWAIAEQLRDAGAELAFTYQAERLRTELEKLTADMPGTLLFQCDVTPWIVAPLLNIVTHPVINSANQPIFNHYADR